MSELMKDINYSNQQLVTEVKHLKEQNKLLKSCYADLKEAFALLKDIQKEVLDTKKTSEA